ncbi:MAG: hypothetical protein ACRETC_05245 [Gammaproteobacteria bacterium]
MSTHMSREVQSLQIADGGKVLTLNYADALTAHGGESWFGVAVGFRMLQATGEALSQQRLWDRNDLFVLSGHPGGGVRDVIEYVTRCVTRKRFRVESGNTESGCRRGMRFAWEVGDGVSVAMTRLRDGFVPEELYVLLDRRRTPAERTHDDRNFAALKRRLAQRVWDEPLAQLFNVDRVQAGVVGHA